ncbi:MAG TPA: LysR family transcriptional regulator [Gammaproteobacteria bacterium]|nr:LysR family transcriptional regulator [Gammaproteobacteria bacterium]
MAGPRVSLDQWRALVTVVDAGGYAQAAEQLHKTQSTVSYAVQRIEDGLGVPVFTREGRRAVLTPAGHVLYRRGRALIHQAESAEKAAASLAAGWEPELRIAVEMIFPTWLLLQCLQSYAANHPETRIELYESVLEGTDELLEQSRVDLGIASRVPPAFVGDSLMRVRFLPVAAADHPLHRLGREVTREDLGEYRHIVIRDSGTRRTREGAWEVSEQRWTVSHKATSIRALRMGLGFSWVAEEIVREELSSGVLRPLPLNEGSERWTTLYLVHAESVGPGTRHLAELIRNAVRRCASRGGADTTWRP